MQRKSLFTLSAIALLILVLTSFVITQNNKPKAVYKVGSSKVVVWENETEDGRSWKNFKVENVYKEGDEWKSSNSFTAKELIQLKAAIEKAVAEEVVEEKR